MSYKPQDNKKMVVWLSVGFVLVIVLAVAAALLMGPEMGSGRPEGSSGQSESLDGESLGEDISQDEDDGAVDANAMGNVIDNTPVTYNKPGEMRAVYLTPGVDFLTATPIALDKVKSEIDAAIANAVKLTMNTIIIDTKTKDSVLYKNDVLPMTSEAFDVMEYIVTKARANNLYVYAIYDAMLEEQNGLLAAPPAVTGGVLDASVSALKSLSGYNIDGVLLRGYYNETQSSSYASYLKAGGAIGFENYMPQVPDRLVKVLSETMRSDARGVQFGLLTDPVWLNSSQNEAGSATNASFTAMGSGNADVKAYIEDKLVDFVAVEAYGSLSDQAVNFSVVAKWWGELCSRRAVDMYLVQYSSRMGNSTYAGWGGSDELAKQAAEARDVVGYSGSIFNSLGKLVENPGGGTDTLLKVFKDEVNPDFLFTELTVSKPEKTSFTTEEKTVTFTGGSDPTQPVTINGEEVKTDETGFFSQMYELKAGANTFTIEHKGKTMNYTVTRKVQVLKEMSPTGNLTVEAGMEITVTALAYQGAKVTASVGGSSFALRESTSDDDDTDRESSYVKYTGSFTVPSSSAGQSLGQISVSASYDGASMSLSGAHVKVNRKADIGDGEPVRVTAAQAETFSTSKLNDISDPDYYPLPKGVLDYTVGDQIVYKDGSNTYTYYKLASGLRVYANDITSTSDEAGGNAIKGIKVESDSRYTTVTLFMNQLVSYTLRTSSSAVSIDFHNTKSVPDNLSLNKNPLFSSANWSGTTLKLSLKNGMLGYKAYTQSGAIVFRFNNPPAMNRGGLGGAYIVVDAGHGGSDPGAISFPGMTEAEINAAIARKLVSALEGRGASVKLIGSGTSLSGRVAAAESYNANLFISVHNNSATASAKGSEAYYFRSWASGLAKGASSGAASALGTTNRGGKYGLYYVTRVSQFPAILAECGFITNESEYKKLCTSSYQNKIANYLASAIEDYFDDMGGGTVATGTQSAGSTGGVTVTGVTLNKTELTLGVGASEKLTATVAPSNASQNVTWKSSNTKIATVADDGTVKGVKEGTATITVTTEDGGKTATCKVTVSKDLTVTLDASELDLAVGGSATLKATVKVGGTVQSGEKVTWKSSDTKIATVDQNGKVTAVKEGSVTITATSATDTTKTAACKVTVKAANVPVTGVSLNKTSLSLTEGESEKLIATLAPDNATNKKVTWASSDTSVATVGGDGTVKALKEGKATITVKTEDGGKTAQCEVTVAAGRVQVQGVLISQTELELDVGGSAALKATVNPGNATNKRVTWSSSDPKIASVDANGRVTAKSPGIATITVKTEDGSFEATCEVEVLAPSSSESSEAPPETSSSGEESSESSALEESSLSSTEGTAPDAPTGGGSAAGAAQ